MSLSQPAQGGASSFGLLLNSHLRRARFGCPATVAALTSSGTVAFMSSLASLSYVFSVCFFFFVLNYLQASVSDPRIYTQRHSLHTHTKLTQEIGPCSGFLLALLPVICLEYCFEGTYYLIITLQFCKDCFPPSLSTRSTSKTDRPTLKCIAVGFRRVRWRLNY